MNLSYDEFVLKYPEPYVVSFSRSDLDLDSLSDILQYDYTVHPALSWLSKLTICFGSKEDMDLAILLYSPDFVWNH